jgi:hypothetical protein
MSGHGPEETAMPRRLNYALLMLAALATACTTLTADERSAACRATDWTNYGYNDGLLGVPADQREKKFADCAELGDPADFAAYQAGRAEGLQAYCTLENGYDVGYEGKRYRKVCPPGLEVGFLQGYEQGRKDRPHSYYPHYGFGLGFGYYRYPYFGPRFGYRYYGQRRRHGGDGK